MLFVKPHFPFRPNVLSNLYKKEILLDEKITAIGFVVNIYDPVNFDVDIIITDMDREKLKSANVETYVYDDYKNCSLVQKSKRGQLYRCRIYGIGVDRQMKPDIKRIPLFNKLKKKIDELDGWIVCDILGIDNHSRLLVDLYLPYRDANGWNMFDVKKWILEKEYFFMLNR